MARIEEKIAPIIYMLAPCSPDALPLRNGLIVTAPVIEIGQIRPLPIPMKMSGKNIAKG